MITENDTLSPKLEDAINRIIKRENLRNVTIVCKSIPTSEAVSYLATLQSVTIEGESDTGKKDINLFIKTKKANEEQQAIYSLADSYVKEAFAYKELLRVFSELQEEFKVPIAERFKAPYGYDESDKESLIIENLSVKGFGVWDRMKCVPLKFAEFAIAQMAKFHGLSMVLEEKRPKYFNEKVKTLEQPFYYNGYFHDFVENINVLALSCLDSDVRLKVEKFLQTARPKYEQYTTGPSPVKCLVHGDFRANNVMLRYENGEISDVAVIDFQLLFYGCPIIDLIYFLFGCTDQEFRKQHLFHLKNLYHVNLTKYLEYFDVDIEKVYPKREFEKLFKERLDYGLMFSLWFIPVTHANEGELPDLTECCLAELSFNLNDVIKSRVRGIVDDFIDWGYL